MDAKLTLNVDKEIVGKAKKYARSKGRSLSDLVEDYLKFLTRQIETETIKISPRVKSLLGSIKVPDGFDYKKELSERLKDKYLGE
ncbi:MAG: hypothetical protein KAS29_16040 [Bacteroidales bacterium]|nr:hypothetical protein [Bacteroidales bacterium]